MAEQMEMPEGYNQDEAKKTVLLIALASTLFTLLRVPFACHVICGVTSSVNLMSHPDQIFFSNSIKSWIIFFGQISAALIVGVNHYSLVYNIPGGSAFTMFVGCVAIHVMGIFQNRLPRQT